MAVKTLLTPRMELQAAVVVVRLVEATKRSSRKNIKSVHCWTDSQNTLAWIRAKDALFSVFVSNRVAKIHDCTRPVDWRYVPTSMNIADGASRGHCLEVLLSTSEWIKGPEFLRHEESQWPVEQKDFTESQESSQQEALRVMCGRKASSSCSTVMPKVDKFSKWTVAIHTVTTLLRWLAKVRKKIGIFPSSYQKVNCVGHFQRPALRGWKC